LHSLGERLPFMPNFVRGDVELVPLRLDARKLAACRAELFMQLLARGAEFVVGASDAGKLRGLVLFDQEQFSQGLPGGQHREVDFHELRSPLGEPRADVRNCRVSFLLVTLRLFELSPQHFDALLTAGRGHLAGGRFGLRRGSHGFERLQADGGVGLRRFESRRLFRGGLLAIASAGDLVLVRGTLLVARLHFSGGTFCGNRRLFELAPGGGGPLAMFGELDRERVDLGYDLGERVFLGRCLLGEPRMEQVLMGQLAFDFGQLFVASADFAAPREQTGRGLAWTDDECAVGGE
jgi:hypothetical protein